MAIEQVVVAEGNGVLRKGDHLVGVEGQLVAQALGVLDQPIEVVGALERTPAGRDHRLEPLLDCLLGVEPDHAVGNATVAGKLAHGGGVLVGLVGEDGGDVSAVRLRQGLDRRGKRRG